MVVVGVNRMIGYPSARDFTGGLWTACIGAWLFAEFEATCSGLTFRNSWPVLHHHLGPDHGARTGHRERRHNAIQGVRQ